MKTNCIYFFSLFFNIFKITKMITYKHNLKFGPRLLMGSLITIFLFINSLFVHATAWYKDIAGINTSCIKYTPQGNILIAGNFNSPVDFDPSSNEYTISPYQYFGLFDASTLFVAEYDEFGNFLWAKAFQSASQDNYYIDYSSSFFREMELDNQGNIYLCGTFLGVFDFDPSGAEYIVEGTHDDAFVLKLDSTGNLIWVRTWGKPTWLVSGYSDVASDLSIGPNDECFVVGSFYDQILFGEPNASFSVDVPTNNYRAYVIKFDESGFISWFNHWEATTSLSNVGCNSSGDIILGGVYTGTIDFDLSENSLTQSSIPGAFGGNIFLMKLTNAGSFGWVKSLVGSGTKSISDIILDENDNIFICGLFRLNVDFDPSGESYNLTAEGLPYASFLASYDDDGNFLFARNHEGDNQSLQMKGLGIYDQGLFIWGRLGEGTIYLDGTNPIGQLETYTDGVILIEYTLEGDYIGYHRYEPSDPEILVNLTSGAISPEGRFTSAGYCFGSIDFDLSDGELMSPNSQLTYLTSSNLQGVNNIISQSKEFEIQAYPNPSNTFFYIPELTPSGSEITLSTLTGTVISKQYIKRNEPIMVNDLRAGLYLYHYHDGNKQYFGKILVR